MELQQSLASWKNGPDTTCSMPHVPHQSINSSGSMLSMHPQEAPLPLAAKVSRPKKKLIKTTWLKIENIIMSIIQASRSIICT
jgi:hypothetical protein